MTTYWPFWAGGLALASIMLIHWLLLGGLLGVSGHITGLVNRWRFGAPKNPANLLFLFGLALGGLLSVLLGHDGHPEKPAPSVLWPQFFGSASWVVPVVLTLGGLLVGFGTRMAGGCTSGHGLNGVSRLQPGSLLATAAFFGAAVAVSFLLEAL